MSVNNKSKTLIYIIMFLSGVVVGTLVGNITAGISFLSWLSFGIHFGTENPVSLNLGVLSLDFGLSINLTIACIICIFASLIVARKVL